MRDRVRGATFRVTVRPRGGQFFPSDFGVPIPGGMSDNGRWVAFGYFIQAHPGCCLAGWIYVRDRLRHTTRRVTPLEDVGPFERPLDLSANGQWLTFQELDDHFNAAGTAVRNLVTGRTHDIHGGLTSVVATRDAHYVAVDDLNANASGDTVLRWNRITRNRVPVITQRAADNEVAGISSDGRYVSVVSDAPNPVPGDTNGRRDIFRFDLQTHTVLRIDLTAAGMQIPVGVPRIIDGAGEYLSEDGTKVAFASRSGRIVAGDTNHAVDVFVRGPIPRGRRTPI